jgi:hypothetical protein
VEGEEEVLGWFCWSGLRGIGVRCSYFFTSVGVALVGMSRVS